MSIADRQQFAQRGACAARSPLEDRSAKRHELPQHRARPHHRFLAAWQISAKAATGEQAQPVKHQ
jgi:hypothetical protein